MCLSALQIYIIHIYSVQEAITRRDIFFLFNCVVWFGACRNDDFRKKESVVKRESKKTGNRRNLSEECNARIYKLEDKYLR